MSERTDILERLRSAPDSAERSRLIQELTDLESSRAKDEAASGYKITRFYRDNEREPSTKGMT